jgi:RimJ/RimL family protein N-acetyltransferase
VVQPGVHLRPLRESDLELLDRSCTDPAYSLPFEWNGFQSAEVLRRRWADDGFLGKDPHYLAVAQADDTAIGLVMWRDPHLGGRDGWAWEIGILLAPEHRGRGAGTEAQRLLAEYLFAVTTTHRLCANTELDNIAEQRALTKCGFQREGVLRQAGFRGGQWRDVVAYALLRDET